MERLTKTTINLREDGGRPDRNSNRVPPKYKSKALPLEPEVCWRRLLEPTEPRRQRKTLKLKLSS
jgi:hypothetical protein